jgi:hypothetical protein
MVRNCLCLLIWHDFFRWARNNYDLGHVTTAFHFLFGYFGVKKRVDLLRDVLKIHIFDRSDVRRLSGRRWTRRRGEVGLLSATFSQYLTTLSTITIYFIATWMKVTVLILERLLRLHAASTLLCWLRLVSQLFCCLLMDDHKRCIISIPRLFLLRCHVDLFHRILPARALVDFV